MMADTVAILANSWVCSRLIAGIDGLNSTEGTDMRLLCLLSVVLAATPETG
jgi:hypothetical protein